jgi:uncharacterized protein (DUF302 family)
MAYYYSRNLKIPFNEVLSKITQTLQQQGFGIITTIDIKDTLKQKLNVNFRNYKILGACIPNFAYKAISLESHVGLMLPCNIVVQQHENGEVEVSAENPLETTNKAFTTTNLKKIATEVSDRLRTAIDDLNREIPKPKHEEALPSTLRNENVNVSAFINALI